jgi:hypothetical protein
VYQALGGSGYYTWQSLKPAQVTVNAHGIVAPLELGHTLVRAYDRKNPRYFGEANVWWCFCVFLLRCT